MVTLNRGGTYASVSSCTRSTDDVEVGMIDCPLEVDCDDDLIDDAGRWPATSITRHKPSRHF